jgi:hypothetical protein
MVFGRRLGAVRARETVKICEKVEISELRGWKMMNYWLILRRIITNGYFIITKFTDNEA